MTSQSTYTVRSPRTARLVTARRLRPMSRWISTVRPPWRPDTASREERSRVEPGNREYSAVSHPWPVPRSRRGTPFVMLAVHNTRVDPSSNSTEPSAEGMKPGVMRSSRNAVGPRSTGVDSASP